MGKLDETRKFSLPFRFADDNLPQQNISHRRVRPRWASKGTFLNLSRFVVCHDCHSPLFQHFLHFDPHQLNEFGQTQYGGKAMFVVGGANQFFDFFAKKYEDAGLHIAQLDVLSRCL